MLQILYPPPMIGLPVSWILTWSIATVCLLDPSVGICLLHDDMAMLLTASKSYIRKLVSKIWEESFLSFKITHLCVLLRIFIKLLALT